ncbi:MULTISPECIES: DinB family protein [unclassified Leeuwenhoekiella]|uniref:DinB family protein n=1 Tax=unclassified Leeuwenhoekiella TaxID=2615029 RepID=UPI000C3841BA|nr:MULTISPECIES: DinB family protein [unclassified Leeuwenhoekiella]MAW95196.1 metal-dependent hydrolase [Leeuwenhoekiella sp.]MBA81881.1 metal-dependent hydrolase [Leeuwenhoekiella sp.]|tara:strand:- start:11559 stop:12074 length:516 start_codon:yes stop_codon:yes gene_type:complete
MKKHKQPEVWLRGPIPEVPQLLQPAAHALLQTCEELPVWLEDFDENLLWTKPAGRASIGFHLQHLIGVLDRMMTYSKEEKLTEAQFNYLNQEGTEVENITVADLIAAFKHKVDEALAYFKILDTSVLLESRKVGRKALPSTTLGLLFHAAEHSQRHLGQILVTASLLKYEE